MPIRSVTLRILGESKDALTKMKLVNAEADKLEKRKVNVKIGVDLDDKDVTALKAKVAALSKLRATITVKLDTAGLLADFAKIKTELAALRSLSKDIKIEPSVDVRNLMLATAELKKMGLSAANSGASLRQLGRDTQNVNSIMGTIFQRGHSGFHSFFSFLTGDVKLFAGLLGTISTFHLLFDAILEVAIVWTTAAAAAVAFGVAAIPTVDKIYDHMKNLMTVSKATGQNIPPLTGAFQKLATAVQPQVYQIFGDALTIMNSRTGLFSKLALEAGSVLEHFAARIAVALRTGGGLSDFLDQATSNLAGLLGGFASFFHIIGSLMSVMPGYAEILLHFGDALLSITAFAVNAAKPFIGATLWLHGFIVWAGLGATVAWALGRAIVFMGDKAIGSAIRSMISFGALMVEMVGEFGVATAAAGAFDIAMATLGAVNPLIWVGAAAAAIAGLVFWMRSSKSEAQKWGDALQKNIDNASTISEGLALAQQDATSAAARLGESSIKLASTQKFMTVENARGTASVKLMTGAYSTQATVVAQNREQWQRFNSEVQFNRGRMQGLEKVYGTQTQVMGLLNAAGVTQAEWQDRTATGWAILTQKINATIAGYKAMGQSGSTLNNDLNVMDRNITGQYQAMQKLNQAWDQFISDVTGTQNTFDTVALGFRTLDSNAATASTTLGHVHLKIGALGTAMDGLTKNDLALNQAFQQQVSNLNGMFDSWRQAGLATNIFNSGVKAGIAPLLKYAQGSKSATFELIALAQEAGFKLAPTMQNLTKWVGNTKGALQKMKDASNQATIQEALLTGSMKAQGQYLSTSLLRDIDQAVLRYKGVSKAADAYAQAIANQGIKSQAAHSARDQLIRDIFNAERQMGASKSAAEKLTAAMLKIPTNIVSNIIEHGVGNFTITGPTGFRAQGPGGHGGPPVGARGLFIRQGTTPTADDVLARVSKGELVVPTKFVNAGLVDHLRGKIPGFGQGGFRETGNLGVLSGNAALGFDRMFKYDFTSAMENTMTATMKAMIAAAKRAAAAAFGSGGPASASARAFQAYAFSLFPHYGWGADQRAPLVALWNGESGWNNMARNPSSGAFGIPQALPPGKMGAAAAAGNGAAQIRWGEGYISSVYGSPGNAYRIWLSRSPHWYAKGTKGAAPGWAWTGEFGPELIKMKGGETVLDHQTSLRVPQLASGSYGSGTGFDSLMHPRHYVRSVSGDTYNVTVQGDSDPDAAALRIIQKIAKYKKKRGNAPLGIG